MWLFLIFGVLIHIIFSSFSIYYYLRWIDVPMHFLGGLWLGLAGIYICDRMLPQIFRKKENLSIVAVALLTALIAGSLWEIIELRLFPILKITLINYEDTPSDIFYNLLGSSAGAIYFISQRRKHHK